MPAEVPTAAEFAALEARVTQLEIPAPAAAAGYRVRTFGDEWHGFDFYGNDPAGGHVRHADGSITVRSVGNSYGAQICTARVGGPPWDKWTGVAFVGGFYVEGLISYSGGHEPPGFGWWANDLESMNGGSVGDISARHWPGQPADFGNWVELDFCELNAGAGRYGICIHNWYGGNPETGDVHTETVAGSPVSTPTVADFSQPHRYGFLWVPASDARGEARWYFDGVQVGNTVSWERFKPHASPPPAIGTTAFSVVDTRHIALIFGTGGAPATLHQCAVWQASTARLIRQ